MNVAASQILDVFRHVYEYIEAFLDAHSSHVANEIRLALFQSRVGGDRLESFQVRAITNNENIFWSKASPIYGEISVTAVGGHDDITEAVSQLLKPDLG